MKNSVIKFDTEEVGDYIVSDYFSKDIDISKFFSFDESFIDVYKTETNDKLERISNELYGSPDYWDILLLLNNRDPLFDMTYNYDIVDSNVEKMIEKFNILYSHPPLDSNISSSLGEQIKQKSEESNESLRNIYIIKPSRLSEVVLLLKQRGVM